MKASVRKSYKIAAFGAALGAGMLLPQGVQLARACRPVLPAFLDRYGYIEDTVADQTATETKMDNFTISTDSMYGLRNNKTGQGAWVGYRGRPTGNNCKMKARLDRIAFDGMTWTLGTEGVGPTTTSSTKIYWVSLNVDGIANQTNGADDAYAVSWWGSDVTTGALCKSSWVGARVIQTRFGLDAITENTVEANVYDVASAVAAGSSGALMDCL